MAKFKVGDEVRILPRKAGQRTQYPHYSDEMCKYTGRTRVVTHVIIDEHVFLEGVLLKGIPYIWHEDWVELASKPIISKEDMEAMYG